MQDLCLENYITCVACSINIHKKDIEIPPSEVSAKEKRDI